MFFPNAYLDSVQDVDFIAFKEMGYKAVLFDIDNTLVCHGAPATPEIIGFFKNLHVLGYQTMVMSNNKEPRVKSFAEAVGGIGYVYKANKPAKKSYLHCMEVMGTDNSNTLFVGDQLFTDVWGAKRCGIHSILVKPIDKKEEIQIVLKRYLERIVLHFYKKECEKRERSH
jgi:HAD superfamily phosphatase (TIGR01668 family)